MVSVTGCENEYAKVGVSIADIATGMYAYSGILTALFERSRTGDGSTIEVAMLDALGEWMMQPAYYSIYGDRENRRTGARHASIAPYGPYRTGDGSAVFLGVQSDREWGIVCREVIHRPDLVDDPRFARNTERVENNDAITPLIEASLQGMTADEAVVRLEEVGIACARLRTPAEFFHHPQLQARDRWRTIETPRGPIEALLPPVVVSGREAAMGAVPRLGEHNELLRDQYGPSRSVTGAQT
jgi:crotonobetainyl-CoA:carnitine CoA-transferase CaiB-like acyl-CoA transferase